MKNLLVIVIGLTLTCNICAQLEEPAMEMELLNYDENSETEFYDEVSTSIDLSISTLSTQKNYRDNKATAIDECWTHYQAEYNNYTQAQRDAIDAKGGEATGWLESIDADLVLAEDDLTVAISELDLADQEMMQSNPDWNVVHYWLERAKENDIKAGLHMGADGFLKMINGKEKYLYLSDSVSELEGLVFP